MLLGGLIVSSLASPVGAVQDVVITITPTQASMCWGSGSTTAITVTVLTAAGEPVANQAVALTILDGTGTISPTVSQTAQDGRAAAIYTASDDPEGAGVVVIAAALPEGASEQRGVTTIFVQNTDLIAAHQTTQSVPGSTLVGDLLTTHVIVMKAGVGTPVISLLRFTHDPTTWWSCGILPLRSHERRAVSAAPAVSAYTLAHLTTATGTDEVDLTFAYGDPGRPVGLHWWNAQDKRWQLLTSATVDPATTTVHLHVTPTTTPSLTQLTTARPFFVVVALHQQWLPYLTRAAIPLP
jgi:hypothetical protein